MNKEVYEMIMDVSGYCRKTGFQACHICNRLSCGDNDHPAVYRMKMAESQLKILKKSMLDFRNEVMEAYILKLSEDKDVNVMQIIDYFDNAINSISVKEN